MKNENLVYGNIVELTQKDIQVVSGGDKAFDALLVPVAVIGTSAAATAITWAVASPLLGVVVFPSAVGASIVAVTGFGLYCIYRGLQASYDVEDIKEFIIKEKTIGK